MTGATWKTRDETFHGSKWGYVVVALVILVFLSLIWIIFAALRGYPFVELIPTSTAGLLIIVFGLFMFLAGAKEIFIGGAAWSSTLAFNPTIIVVFLSLLLATFFFVSGVSGQVMLLMVGIIIIISVILMLKGMLSFLANPWATLLFAFSIMIYVAIVFLVGSSIPTANILIALLAFVLLAAFFPFAIFIIDLFSYEHE